jgi:hypothetical protein
MLLASGSGGGGNHAIVYIHREFDAVLMQEGFDRLQEPCYDGDRWFAAVGHDHKLEVASALRVRNGKTEVFLGFWRQAYLEELVFKIKKHT